MWKNSIFTNLKKRNGREATWFPEGGGGAEFWPVMILLINSSATTSAMSFPKGLFSVFFFTVSTIYNSKYHNSGDALGLTVAMQANLFVPAFTANAQWKLAWWGAQQCKTTFGKTSTRVIHTDLYKLRL